MSQECDRAVEETRAFLESRPSPDVTSTVMSRIADLEPAPAPGRFAFVNKVITLLWSPRQISIRPAFAIAGTVAVALLALQLYSGRGSVPAPEVAPEASDTRLFVQFRLETTATRVQLAGSFTNWEPRYELRQSAPGIWTATVPLTQGVHDYAFVVDGMQWVPDPYAQQIGDGFGGTNSRLSLLSPEPPQS